MSDYRNEFKNKSKEQLQKLLNYYNEKLQLDFLGTCQDYYLKRISFIENKLKNN